jgi:hypothetical protein
VPKISSIFSNSVLRAADVTAPRDVTILGWHIEFLFGKEEYVLELKNEPAGLRLTGTLARDIKASLGGEDEMDAWIGRIVTIYPSQMKIRDKDSGEEKLVDIIRAMASEADKTRKVLTRSGGDDDDMPF